MALLAVKKEGTLSDKAYDIIKKAIISNDFKPGDVMVEETLAEQLSISRTPIRAALKQLQFEHILTSSDSKNLVVADVTVTDVQNVGVVRSTLEFMAVSLLKDKLTSENLKELRRISENQKKDLDSGEEQYLDYLDQDYRFHVLLARLTGNSFLAEMVEKANFVTRRFLTLSGTLEKYGRLATEEHEAILQALEAGNVEEAAQAMSRHIQNAYSRALVR